MAPGSTYSTETNRERHTVHVARWRLTPALTALSVRGCQGTGEDPLAADVFYDDLCFGPAP